MQYVYAKVFKTNEYMLGRIVKIIGNRIYGIKPENGLIWKRHVKHITP